MKTKKQFTNRILSLVLAFVMVLGTLPMSSLTASAANYVDGDACESTTGCSGTYANGFCTVCDGYQPAEFYEYSNEYCIYNAGQLYWFADFVNSSSVNRLANARLMSDIVVNDQVLDADGNLVANASALRTWTPIATTGDSYRGVFLGKNHSISGLYCVQTGTGATAGLFASMMEATVESVSILDSWFEASCGSTEQQDYNGSTVAGAISAFAQGSNIRYCYSEAAVKAGMYAGGIVGNTWLGYVSGCGNGGTVTGTYNFSRVGGIVGNTGGTFASSRSVVVTNCWNNGVVRNTDSAPKCVGALVGEPFVASVYNSYYDATKCSNAFGTTKDINTGSAFSNFKQENVAGKTSAEFANGTVCDAFSRHQCIKWGYTSETHKKVCVLCSATVEGDSGIHVLTSSFNCTAGGYCYVCGYRFEPDTPHRFTNDSPSDCIHCNFTCYYHVIGEDGTCVSCDHVMIPVTDIQLARHAASANAIQGENISLSGVTVLPAGASFQTVKWYTVSGNVETPIEGNRIPAAQAGTLTLRAKVENGKAMGTAFTKDFVFTVEAVETEYDIANGAVTITKSDDNNIKIVQGDSTVAVPKDQTVRIYGTTESPNYVLVTGNASVNLVLDNCTITMNSYFWSPIMISSGSTADITLIGENAVTGYGYGAGLFVEKGSALTIGGMGSLTATGGSEGYGAGIGGGDNSEMDKNVSTMPRNCGSITINSGTVTAVSYNAAAAIGASRDGSLDVITINGGTVKATNYFLNDLCAAGIGTAHGTGGTVKITGGTVTATGGNSAAGIGNYGNTAPDVIITGGTVRAIGTNAACGIGKGWKGTNGTTTITGGNVYAEGYSGYGNIGGLSGVSLKVITLCGETEEVIGAVSEITGASGYSLKDVVLIDGKLYLYLPDSSDPTAVKVDGVTYRGTVTDGAGTFYYEHICAATQTTATCKTFAVCDVCGVNVGALNPENHESEEYRYEVNEKEPLMLHDVYYTCCNTLKETALHRSQSGICTICGYYDKNVPKENGVYLISNAAELLSFAEIVEDERTANAKLTADIDMTGTTWRVPCSTRSYFRDTEYPDVGYQGTFDGDGHVIKNITIRGGAYATAGLFGTLSGTVKNLGMENVTIDISNLNMNSSVGSIVGLILGGEVSNCYAKNVSGVGDGNEFYAGGLAALNFGGTIKNCYVVGFSVPSSNMLSFGGIVCQNTGSESGSTRIGTIVNCYTDKASIVAAIPGTVTNSTHSVSAETFASGEIAYKLNGSTSEGDLAWGQKIGEDAYPVLGGDTVYYDAANGYNNHVHEWKYTVDGNKISANCNAVGCTNTDGGNVTLNVTDAFFTGSEIGATADSSLTNGATFKITYNDGSETAPSSIGTYTVKLTVYENGTEKQSVTAEYKISYLTAPTPAYTILGGYQNGDTYWFKIGASVTVKAPEGFVVSKEPNGTYGDSVSFSESDSKVIYLKRTSDGAMTAAINIGGISFDGTGATGKITIGNRGFWEKLLNKITFGLFFKGDAVAKVETTDKDSGVKSIQYYIADEDLIDDTTLNDAAAISTLETAVGSSWKSYNNEIALNKNAKNVVYVKITDNVGYETYLSSQGIVLYSDAEAETESVSTTYKAGENKDVSVKLNGNTVKEIKNGTTVLTAGTDYSVSAEGTITLIASYLDTLNAGEYTFTVSYNPLGLDYVEADGNDAPETTTFKIEIGKADGKVSNISDISKTYDGQAVANPTFEKLGDGAYTIEYKVKEAADSTYTTTAPKNAGEYIVRVFVAEGTNHKEASATAGFTIERAELTGVSVQQNGKLTYDGGKALTPAVTKQGTALNGAEVLFMYSTDGTDYSDMPTFREAGTYTVHYQAYTDDNNFIVRYGTFTVTIDKAVVNEPTIDSKPYNGSAQKADISDTDLYAVVQNNGGTAKGSYAVVLELKDSANYKWSTTDEAEVTVQFVISEAQNTWTTTPAINGWTYGETPNTPAGAAKYGTVKVAYSGKANDGTDYSNETAPTKAGSYTATFTVDGTEDYSGLETSVDFTIEKATYDMTGAKWDYAEAIKYDGKAHSVWVDESSLPSGVSVSNYTGNTNSDVGKYTANVSLNYDYYNYNQPNFNYLLDWEIVNNWTPTEYTVSGEGWMNQFFVIKAADGYKVSLTNTADGEWSDSLTYSDETDNGSVTFYLRNGTDGTISLAKTVTYKLDKTAPTGKVEFVERNGWETFLNTISFGLFYKDEVTVKVTANDTLSGVDKIEYASSNKAMTLDEVKEIADWTKYNGSFGVTLEDAKKFVYFIRITDKAGNVTYLSTDGAEYDTTAPAIDGIENGKTYYTTQKVTVTDKNIETVEVTVNGAPVSDPSAFHLSGNIEAEFVISATDKAGNNTTVTVTMKPIKDLAKATENLGNDNVTSADAPALKELVEKLNELIADPDTSDDGERETLEQHKHIAESLLETIEETAEQINKVTGEVDNYDDETVTSEDKDELEQIINEIDALFATDNLTDEERTALEEAKEAAIELFAKIEEIADQIGELTGEVNSYNDETVTSGDKETIEQIIDEIDTLQETENLTAEEKMDLEDTKVRAEGLLEKIAETAEQIGELTDGVNGYDDETVTSEDKDELEQIITEIDALLETDNLTEEEKAALEEVKDKAEGLLETIDEATKATETENTDKVKDVTAENVTPDDKTDLEKAKEDLENALEDNSGNYTEDEKKAIEDEIKRIDDALEVIGNVEAAEELIDKLPDTIKKDDEAAIKAADDAYNALSDYEKSLVDKDAKKALDDAKTALAELNKPKDPNSPATGDNSNMFLWIALLFISGGAVITLTVVDRKRRNVANK